MRKLIAVVGAIATTLIVTVLASPAAQALPGMTYD
jgi:hypothetical protein